MISPIPTQRFITNRYADGRSIRSWLARLRPLGCASKSANHVGVHGVSAFWPNRRCRKYSSTSPTIRYSSSTHRPITLRRVGGNLARNASTSTPPPRTLPPQIPDARQPERRVAQRAHHPKRCCCAPASNRLRCASAQHVETPERTGDRQMTLDVRTYSECRQRKVGAFLAVSGCGVDQDVLAGAAHQIRCRTGDDLVRLAVPEPRRQPRTVSLPDLAAAFRCELGSYRGAALPFRDAGDCHLTEGDRLHRISPPPSRTRCLRGR